MAVNVLPCPKINGTSVSMTVQRQIERSALDGPRDISCSLAGTNRALVRHVDGSKQPKLEERALDYRLRREVSSLLLFIIDPQNYSPQLILGQRWLALNVRSDSTKSVRKDEIMRVENAIAGGGVTCVEEH
jgi:hypothetical protein